MTRSTPLPEVLRGRPFTVAEALALGVPPDVLAGRRLRRPHRGVRVPAELPDTLPVRCAALQLVLPAGCCLGGRTALGLHRVPLPLLAPGAPDPLCVVAPPGRQVRMAAVQVRQRA